MSSVHGLHHITCICGEPQENLEFYTGVLGLRLVKRSVNQDAPDTYHLFYADAEGHAGTDITFFPWPRMAPARPGVGLANEVGFAVPPGALGFWRERLAAGGVELLDQAERFGEIHLRFRDPHGLVLSLTESGDARAFTPWPAGPVPGPRQIRGFHAARLWERESEPTALFLAESLGFEEVAREGEWRRFGVDGGGSGRWLEVREDPDGRRGRWGTGGVHHVAFRVGDDEEQLAVRRRVASAGASPTPVIDRFWFRSVYFREPGGTLFELATEGPGFTADEELDRLGERLILPPWLESRRAEIEAALPPLAG
jgi:glyoxalase family protein